MEIFCANLRKSVQIHRIFDEVSYYIGAKRQRKFWLTLIFVRKKKHEFLPTNIHPEVLEISTQRKGFICGGL